MMHRPSRVIGYDRVASSRCREMCRRGPLRLPMLLLAVTVALIPAAVRGETLSISELNEKVEQWTASRKVPPEVLYQVEGRASLFSRHRLQFKNCKVPFESEAELSEPTRRNANLEATGVVVREEPSGKYVFRIRSIREMPTDLETFFDRRRALRGQPAEKWYELARWAEQRGNFYKDYELLSRSEEAYQQGLDQERHALSTDRTEGLFALAEKARQFHMPVKAIQELQHEALTLEWQQSRRQSGAELNKLAQRIAELLPDSKQPLDEPDSALQTEYFAAPRETYRAADAEKRLMLHRLLYADVLLRIITAELAPDGANGFEVAAKLIELIPEQRALAESFRDKALTARAREVESLSKTDMLALAEEYRNRQQPQRADQIIESWLTLRQRRLDPDDTDGLIRLTDDYRRLLHRGDLANQLLKDAWQKHPRATDLAARLQQMGFRLHDGAWLNEDEYNSRPEGRLEQAIRTGRVEPGMSGSNVRKSLGEPQRAARSATSGQVTEVWTYDQTGSSRLVVRLKRHRRGGDLTVVDVVQTAAP